LERLVEAEEALPPGDAKTALIGRVARLARRGSKVYAQEV
jgi:hypothetical protein